MSKINKENMVWKALKEGNGISAIRAAKKCPIETKRMLVINFYKWEQLKLYQKASKEFGFKLTKEEKSEAFRLAIMEDICAL